MHDVRGLSDTSPCECDSGLQSRDLDLVYEEFKSRIQKKLAGVQSQVCVCCYISLGAGGRLQVPDE